MRFDWYVTLIHHSLDELCDEILALVKPPKSVRGVNLEERSRKLKEIAQQVVSALYQNYYAINPSEPISYPKSQRRYSSKRGGNLLLLLLALILSPSAHSEELNEIHKTSYKCLPDLKGGFEHFQDGTSKLSSFKKNNSDELILLHHTKFEGHFKKVLNRAGSKFNVTKTEGFLSIRYQNSYSISSATDDPDFISPSGRMCDSIYYLTSKGKEIDDTYVIICDDGDFKFNSRNNKFIEVEMGRWFDVGVTGNDAPNESVITHGTCTEIIN